MTVIYFLSAAVFALWIIPGAYIIQTRSVRVILEAAVLMLLSMALPFIIQFAKSEMYGLAGKVTLNDGLFIAGLQLILWLAGFLLPALALRAARPVPWAPRPRTMEHVANHATRLDGS